MIGTIAPPLLVMFHSVEGFRVSTRRDWIGLALRAALCFNNEDTLWASLIHHAPGTAL